MEKTNSGARVRARRGRMWRLAAVSVLLGGLFGAAPLAQAQVVARTHAIDWGMVHQVHELICKLGIREPKIVMAQAILETGWFRSTSLMTRNNLFGFRHVNYLRFDRWEDSVEYYKNWQDQYFQGDANYFSFLERIRYGAPGYSRHVRKIEWTEECPAR